MGAMVGEICHTCGVGEIIAEKVPGREHHYRGCTVKIPADFPIRTCSVCRTEWMNHDEIGEFSDICEDQRNAWLSRCFPYTKR